MGVTVVTGGDSRFATAVRTWIWVWRRKFTGGVVLGVWAGLYLVGPTEVAGGFAAIALLASFVETARLFPYVRFWERISGMLAGYRSTLAENRLAFDAVAMQVHEVGVKEGVPSLPAFEAIGSTSSDEASDWRSSGAWRTCQSLIAHSQQLEASDQPVPTELVDAIERFSTAKRAFIDVLLGAAHEFHVGLNAIEPPERLRVSFEVVKQSTGEYFKSMDKALHAADADEESLNSLHISNHERWMAAGESWNVLYLAFRAAV